MKVSSSILKQDGKKVSRLDSFQCHLYPTGINFPFGEAAEMIHNDNKGRFVTQPRLDPSREDMGCTDRRLYFAIMQMNERGGFEIQRNTVRVIIQDAFLNYDISVLDDLIKREFGVPIYLPDVGGRRRIPSESGSLEMGGGGDYETAESLAVSRNSPRRASPAPVGKMGAGVKQEVSTHSSGDPTFKSLR